LHLIARRAASTRIAFASDKGLARTDARTAARKFLTKGWNIGANVSVDWLIVAKTTMAYIPVSRNALLAGVELIKTAGKNKGILGRGNKRKLRVVWESKDVGETSLGLLQWKYKYRNSE
jgi:hypothetical protein